MLDEKAARKVREKELTRGWNGIEGGNDDRENHSLVGT
jgi:hypothetical protein